MELEPVKRLSKDLRRAAATMTADEARFLVDSYYQMQADRLRTDNQIRAVGDSEPHDTLSWLADNSGLLERNIRSALDVYGDASIVGRWSKSVKGIGPVISAGLLAHIDLEPWRCALRAEGKSCTEAKPHGPACMRQRITTVGHIWRYAGLDPTVTWEKGQKRPWNASLKTLCWKIGESFVKVSGQEDATYGLLYLRRKEYEIRRNESGALAEQAAAKLEKFRIGKGTDARKHYEAGHLPPAHIHARAKRWTVKIFLSHWHAVAFRAAFGENAPRPYAITQLMHAHDILIEDWPFDTPQNGASQSEPKRG
jgi:hypothetical protein